MEAVKKENLITSWFGWHFATMPRFLFSVWENYLWFGLEFFSIPLLLATLFSPWRKYRWSYPKGFNPVEMLNTFISNIFSRLIGAFCRLVLIILGIVCQIFIAIAGVLVILGWMFLPFIIIGLFIFAYGI